MKTSWLPNHLAPGDQLTVGSSSRFHDRVHAHTSDQRPPTGYQSIASIGLEHPVRGRRKSAIHEDKAGRVWVFFKNLAKDWKPGAEKYGTMVEVIDPRARTVIARRRFEGIDTEVMTDDLAVTTKQDQDGFNTFEVFELTLESTQLRIILQFCVLASLRHAVR